MKGEYSLSDVRALLFWTFIMGIFVGLLLSLIWRAAQISHVEHLTEIDNLTEIHSDN
jgi:hypothetical protein